MSVRIWKNQSVVNTITSGQQTQSEVTALADGGYVIVWEDNSTGTSRIQAQIFNAGGSLRGAEFNVIANADPVIDPVVEAMDNGSFAVGYTIDRTGSGSEDSFFSVYDANGAVIDGPNFTSTNTVNDRGSDLLAVGSQMWHGHALNNGGNTDVTLFRWQDDGAGGFNTIGGSQVIPNNTTAGTQDDLRMAELTNGNVVTVWSDAGSVEFRIFTSTGTAVTATDQTVPTSRVNLDAHEVIGLANGGFAIVYDAQGGGFPASGNDVYLRVFAPDGTAFGSEVFINTLNSGNQLNVTLTALNDGGIAVFWTDFNLQPDIVLGQLFDGLGNKRGETFTAATVDHGSGEEEISATTLVDGRIVLSLSEDRSSIDGSNDAITSIILDPRNGVVDGSLDGETLLGSFFDDQIKGFGGDDSLFGLGGRDDLLGGAGNDLLDGGQGGDHFDGGSGIDTVTYINSSDAVNVSLITGRGFGNGDANGDIIEQDTVENLRGSSFGDNLVGDDGINNTISGGGGNDAIKGLGGDDTLNGEGGGDLFFSGFGADAHFGGSGFDTVAYNLSAIGVTVNLNANVGLLGHAAGDTFFSIEQIVGSSSADFIVGGASSDTLDGRAGNDVINGKGGSDILTGGNNNDRFVFEAGNATDRITDFDQAGNDTVDLSSFGFANFAAVQALMSNSAGDTVINFGGGDALRIEDMLMNQLDSSDFVLV